MFSPNYTTPKCASAIVAPRRVNKDFTNVYVDTKHEWQGTDDLSYAPDLFTLPCDPPPIYLKYTFPSWALVSHSVGSCNYGIRLPERSSTELPSPSGAQRPSPRPADPVTEAGNDSAGTVVGVSTDANLGVSSRSQSDHCLQMSDGASNGTSLNQTDVSVWWRITQRSALQKN